jgi:NAD(P)-dependent dehydrogenase (short-subunit alcohol dehydrogenase family)
MTVQRIVLVTGASRGIGAATARLAAADGYRVAVNYVRDEAAATEVVADIEKAGGRAVAIQADVSQEEDVERLFATIDRTLGRLTHLVFNSGVTGPVSRIDALGADAAREILHVNVLGAFLCARAAIPRMSTAKGGQGAPWCWSPRRWRRSAVPANT